MKRFFMYKKLASTLAVAGIVISTVTCSPVTSSASAPDTLTEGGKTVLKSGTKITNDKIVLKGFGSKYSGNAEWDNNMLLWKELEKRTGITVQWDTVVNTEARSKALLLFAAGDLPDILGKNALNMPDVVKFAASKQLVDFSQYMNSGLMPNFKKIYESDINVKISNTDPQGKVYALPSLYTGPNDTVRRFMYINEKWLKNIEKSKPRNINEFLDILRAFKTKDANGNGNPNDEIPMSLGDAFTQTERTIRSLAGIDNVFGQPYNIINDKVKQMYTSENMKQAFTLLNTLYSEGLIEKDIFTRSASEFFARHEDKSYGVTLLIPASDKNFEYGILEPSFGIGGKNSVIWNWSVTSVVTASAFNITSSNKYPQATARWMDYFFGDEGATLVRMGVEGDTYVVNKDGSYSYSPKIKNDPQGIEFAMAKYSFWLGTNTTPGLYPEKLTLPNIEGTLATKAPPVFDSYLSKYVFAMPQMSPALEKELTTLQTEINKYYGECRAAFMTGGMNINTQWNEYVSTLEKLKLSRLEAIYEEAYGIVKKMQGK